MRIQALAKVKKIPGFVRAYLRRNELGAMEQLNRVNLHWCSMQQPDGKENLGDWLSEYIVRETFTRLSGSRNFEENVGETKHLYAIGSILFFDMRKGTVWGSGMEEEAPWYRMPIIYKYDIRAIRGPLTRAALLKRGFRCPEVYGDPAVLLPLFYKPKLLPKKDFVVVKHKDAIIPEGYPEVDVMTRDMFATIDQIVNAKLVISGSLHGIIIAEAYGVPAIFVTQMADRWGWGKFFKYKDWYASTGRATSFPVAATIEEALDMPLPPVPNLTAMQQRLLSAFPLDLWNRAQNNTRLTAIKS